MKGTLPRSGRHQRTIRMTPAFAALLLLPLAATRPAQAQTYSVLYNFQGGEVGGYPAYGALVRDKAGNFYGTTSSGGSSNCGTVFKFVPGTGTESVLHSFTCQSDGGYPYAGLVLSGNMLYGTTAAGGSGTCFGSSGCGVVFALNINLKIITGYHDFLGSSDGAVPYAGLVQDKSGNLYGTTNLGGANNKGTVFKVVPQTMKVTVLHSFTGSDGAYPYSGLTLNSTGTTLYGVTYQGGSNSNGVVFSLPTKGGPYSTLYKFTGSIDGANPLGTIALDPAGNLYGTTAYGGSGYGVVFEVVPASGTESVLYAFLGGTDGANPSSGVARDSSGNLYGTTYSGGASSSGTVFKVSGTTETVLHSFDSSDGANPLCGVLLDSKGDVFGTAEMGGSIGYGVVWKIRP
ncbi:MAG TPA: choice-of-anchor tandem repeat GloVer-containing protein [Terriglobia bacterium]|nr:choice-of-anchor tandem repeat GloVer-containing protein [Terriglobia bacterium]